MHYSFQTPKIELRIFYGTDPLEWLFQAKQFFFLIRTFIRKLFNHDSFLYEREFC